jgi:hypothetical protein
MLKFSEKYDNDKGEIIINTKWIWGDYYE